MKTSTSKSPSLRLIPKLIDDDAPRMLFPKYRAKAKSPESLSSTKKLK